jgi:hypothetical protein
MLCDVMCNVPLEHCSLLYHHVQSEEEREEEKEVEMEKDKEEEEEVEVEVEVEAKGEGGVQGVDRMSHLKARP